MLVFVFIRDYNTLKKCLRTTRSPGSDSPIAKGLSGQSSAAENIEGVRSHRSPAAEEFSHVMEWITGTDLRSELPCTSDAPRGKIACLKYGVDATVLLAHRPHAPCLGMDKQQPCAKHACHGDFASAVVACHKPGLGDFVSVEVSVSGAAFHAVSRWLAFSRRLLLPSGAAEDANSSSSF